MVKNIECPFCKSKNVERFNGGTNPTCIVMYTCKNCHTTFSKKGIKNETKNN